MGLYNLSKDIAEEKNLKDKHPEKLQELQTLYDEWFSEMGEPAKGTKQYEPRSGSGKKAKARKSAEK